MDNKKNLSGSEKEIMEFLWSKNTGASLKEVWEYFTIEAKKSWKKQTVRTFLLRLNVKGYVKIYIDTETKQQVYLASKTKKEYLQSTAQNVIIEFFDNSVYNFLSAFSGGNKLDKESAEQLKKFLNEEE